MDNTLTTVLISLLSGTFAALVTTIITIYATNKARKEERLYKEKRDAYFETFALLFDLYGKKYILNEQLKMISESYFLATIKLRIFGSKELERLMGRIYEGMLSDVEKDKTLKSLAIFKNKIQEELGVYEKRNKTKKPWYKYWQRKDKKS